MSNNGESIIESMPAESPEPPTAEELQEHDRERELESSARRAEASLSREQGNLERKSVV